MYCSSCGSETTPGLKYCTRCGVNLNLSAEAQPQKKFPLLLTVSFLALIGFVLTIGLIAPFAIISETMGRGLNVDSITPVLSLIPLVAFGVVGLLVWLLLRLIKVHQESGSAIKLAEPPQAPVRDHPPARLPAPPESLGSVTEHTTRNFDSLEDRLPKRESVKETR